MSNIEPAGRGPIEEVALGLPHAAHLHCTPDDLRTALRNFNAASEGFFNLTLVKENGQDYNIVLHQGGRTPKVRIRYVATVDGRPITGSTWNVRDIIEEVLTPHGAFDQPIARVVDQTLQGSLGCVLLQVKHGWVASAHFHEGEIWP
jgi:hypothetical protein